MLPHPKIFPLIPHTITLSSPYNQKDFLRRSPKFPSHLYLNSILEPQRGQFNAKVQEQTDLLKIFRSLKRLKKVHQDDLALHRIRLPASKMRSLVKKVHRIKAIGIQDQVSMSKISPARLDLWLKYADGLQSVNSNFTAQAFVNQASPPQFEKEIRLCLKFLPQHHNLRILTVWLPLQSSKTLESVLQFKRYPLSLKTFAIYQKKSANLLRTNYNPIISAFSRLKSLEYLALSGPDLLRVAEVLLEKVTSLSKIKKLNVQGSEILLAGLAGTQFDLNKCLTFQNLRHLKIGNIAENKTLTELINSPPQLESLDIIAAIGKNGSELISQLIVLWGKSLKSLKMDLYHAYTAQTEETIKSLFKRVSELEELTSFRFIFVSTTPLSAVKVDISPGVLESLKGLFSKPVKLRSFEWGVSQTSDPGILLDLLKLLEESRGTLRKLKIFDPFMALEKSQEAWIFNFLRKLERIEELYLTGFDIKEKAFWVDLVDCLLGTKSLRSLRIGKVTGGGPLEKWFTDPLKKIAQKRGLEALEIEAYLRFGEHLTEQPICLKEIMRVNPAFREVSGNVRKLLNTAGLE